MLIIGGEITGACTTIIYGRHALLTIAFNPTIWGKIANSKNHSLSCWDGAEF
jgi:hypothetical protein